MGRGKRWTRLAGPLRKKRWRSLARGEVAPARAAPRAAERMGGGCGTRREVALVRRAAGERRGEGRRDHGEGSGGRLCCAVCDINRP